MRPQGSTLNPPSLHQDGGQGQGHRNRKAWALSAGCQERWKGGWWQHSLEWYRLKTPYEDGSWGRGESGGVEIQPNGSGGSPPLSECNPRQGSGGEECVSAGAKCTVTVISSDSHPLS